jgi:hypothetical protein
MKRAAVNRIRLTLGIIAFSIVVLLLNFHAQDCWVTLPDGKRISVNMNTPLFYFYVNENGKLESLHIEDPQEVVKIIVTQRRK